MPARLDRITIAAPCDADWDSMIGNDRVRFCEHCQLNVNNLSAMTRSQAMRLVAQSRGRLCVRYVRLPTGEILTKLPQKIHQIGRSTSRLAAAAFSATLSVASAAAQGGIDRTSCAVQQPQKISSVSNAVDQGATISGIVRDPNRAVVPQATVTLVNTKTNLMFVYVTQDDGAYKFSLLDSGSYKLSVGAPGFSVQEVKDLELSEASAKTLDVDLYLPIITAEVEVRVETTETVTVTSGAVAISEPKDPLAKAAHQNDLAAVKEQLALGVDVDKWDDLTNANALAYAIENHNREMIRVLLSAGASINSTDKSGSTPVMYLGEGATLDMVRDLLAARADVNAKDGNDSSVLANVIGHIPFEVAKQLIEAGARLDTKDNEGTTVLMRAAVNEDPNVVKLLIRAGVDVAAKNDDGESALTLAAQSARSQNLKALIDAGGTFDLKQDQLNKLLLEVAATEDPPIVKILIDAGADVSVKTDKGETTLMRAAEDGKPETVKILIAAGLDVNEADDDGWTALMYVNEVESARLLLAAGADVTLKNKEGKTALALAAKSNQEDVVNLLKTRGARE